MASWIWLTCLLSLAAFLFLAISGSRTPKSITSRVAALFFAVAALISMAVFVSTIPSPGTAETYLFSFVGMNAHLGFRVSFATVISIISVYFTATVLTNRVMRRRHLFTDKQIHTFCTQLAWWTFGLSFLVMSPTLSQAWLGSLICTLGVIWFLLFDARNILSSGQTRTLSLLVIVAFLAQTLPTWLAWHVYHTVQLTLIRHEHKIGRVAHGAAWVLWLWLAGLLIQWGTLYTIRGMTRDKMSRTACLWLSFALYTASGFYLWAAWPVVVTAHWMTVVVIALAIGISLSLLPLLFGMIRERRVEKSEKRPESMHR
ncbi:hypothetical protein [Alicyclobacillus fodiniaquatilis]|uniref:Uncharacterized protein n=1 Tax=Alicyclobacillus fodiniaquatilis TaxID=1661150 RepID=A0ABW4JHA6_9BACL